MSELGEVGAPNAIGYNMPAFLLGVLTIAFAFMNVNLKVTHMIAEKGQHLTIPACMRQKDKVLGQVLSKSLLHPASICGIIAT